MIYNLSMLLFTREFKELFKNYESLTDISRGYKCSFTSDPAGRDFKFL